MQVNGPWFIEPETQRKVIFRGVNLGGGTKLPVGVPSHEPKGFWIDYDRKVSFVGRPFPLDEADMHMQRLVDHGFTLIRFMVTWEAIEHEGPGIYDEDYLNYVIEILKRCKEYGLKVYLNPHQDTWSRHCGGSGHPGWTHTLAGLNPQHFTATNAAIVHNVHPEPEKFPKMIWNTNYQKLASATLFTLFFAGKTFAPKCIVNGVHVQDYMQSHYIRAFTELARRVHANHLQGQVVIGYDTMNEPGQGYIGWPDITGRPAEDVDFKKGLTPTPFEGMMLGSGIATEVEHWVFTWRGPKRDGRVLVDPEGAQAWLSAEELKTADQSFGWQRVDEWKPGCIWANHGLWDPSTRTVMRPDYFVTAESYAHYWLNFIKDYSDSLLEHHPDAILFIQPPIMEQAPSMPPSLKKMALAPHWYDGLTLVKKKWCSYNVDYINLKRGKYGTGPLRFIRALRLGEKAIRQCFVDQIETLKLEGLETLGDFPFIIGEIGIPYDMEPVKQKSAVSGWFSWMFVWLFGRFLKSNSSSRKNSSDDSSWSTRRSVMLKGNKDNDDKYYPMCSPEAPQNKAMDASIHAAERNLVSYTLWNYVPDNHPKWGDLWNGEDLSIWQGRDNATLRTTVQQEDVTDHSDTSSETLLPETATDGKLSTMTTTSSSSNSFVGSNANGVNVRDIISLHRPHAHKIAGTPLSVEYVSPTYKQRASFVFTYRSSAKVEGPTEVYVPMTHFPLPDSPISPSEIQVSGGRWKAQTQNENYWTLLWWCDDDEADQELRLLGQNIQ